ncbi:UDP-N-acetylmuramate dehydrogenase [Microlunatus sp. Gsoil 973]|uniref:UDP-N-acetylmuramate dehydrogenase n=1 Tax=Microlunatus sp. Gsoil 973 TaxID=2672569 RepID=UPI0012B44B8B|nr:UDP-N-acetylmuramate dehydrogenase [Microlunatus sp. Gsoil 973]QGN35007.1 UDP-N-acetylmuramate dehydrogenase [Microlunatus sp. Gsoil 973]
MTAVAQSGVQLAELTTLRVGGPAAKLITVTTEAGLVDAVRQADAAGEPLLIVGGGSNLLIGDDGFDGTVIKIDTRGVQAEVSSCSGAMVTVAAGEPWDELVARTLAEGWCGLEALSGIPGLVGATPIQNVGAYGAEISHTLASVRTLDRRSGQQKTFAVGDCGFGYRWSRFKAEPGRYVILTVALQLPIGELSAPIGYPQLAQTLDVPLGTRVDAATVRDAVLDLRRSKGMVLDDDDHDTWSAGSFFTNPILPAGTDELLPPSAPRYRQPDGSVKTSAAWLIEQAGFGKGYGTPPATLSGKHTLAITNRGGATADDLLRLARTIRTGVHDRFGIELVPEPNLVNCIL